MTRRLAFPSAFPAALPAAFPAAVLGALAVGLASAACGGGAPIPDDDLALHMTAGATEVASGVAFPLTVVRVWRKDLVPTAWDERALAPLAVRLTASSRREDDRRVEEMRIYRAYAFAREEVVVTPAPMVARALDGGPERRASVAPLVLKVRPLLDATAPGAPEFPTLPPPAPFPRSVVVVGGLLLLASAVAVAARRRRRAGPAPTASPADVVVTPVAPSAAAVAIAALDGVEARGADDVEARRRDATDVTEILRGYVAARFDVPTARRTSAEVLALPFLPPDAAGRAALRDVFARGDAVKFAEAAPDAADRSAHLAAARAFVRATADGGRA